MPSINISSGSIIRGSHAASRGGGSAWGASESAQFYDIEPRITTRFTCESGHEATYEFHEQAELPDTWPCKRCGAAALRIDPPTPHSLPACGPADDHRPVRPGAWYTIKHRREVMTRRSTSDLESLLAERLAVRRAMLAAVDAPADPAA